MTSPDTRPGWRNVRSYYPVVTQLAGVAVFATGFGLLETWAGLVAGGLGLVAVGVAAELGD